MSKRGSGMAPALSGALILGLMATGAQAADAYGGHEPVFRPSYDLQWQQEDTLGFELGLRYWYSHGELRIGDHWNNDTSQSVEAHFRIDDWSTATYARGHAGYGAVIDGEYGSPTGGATYSGGRLAYARADLGYNLYQTDHATFSVFAGYGYNNQELHGTGLDIHALRLGASATATIHDTFGIYGEIAAIPYAWAHAYGDYGNGDGSLYGYSAELMAGFEPAPNVLIRGGIRAEYLAGPIRFDDGFSYDAEHMRWGPLVELSYAF